MYPSPRFWEDLPRSKRLDTKSHQTLTSSPMLFAAEDASPVHRSQPPRCNSELRPPSTDSFPPSVEQTLPVLKMTQSVYQNILDDLVEHPFQTEKAGLLLGPTGEDDLVTHYVPDTNGKRTPASFTLDAEGLNKIVRSRKRVGLSTLGVVHVHPPGVLRPSAGDLYYVSKLFANPKNSEARQILLPIICNGRLYPYIISADKPREILIACLMLV